MRSSSRDVLLYPLHLAAIAVLGLSFAQSASAQPAAELAACRAHTCAAYCKHLGGSPKLTGECSGECMQSCAADIPPGKYVTLNTGDLKTELALLDGTKVSIDTTMSAPSVPGPPLVSVPNPAYATCYAQTDKCKSEPKGEQQLCVANVDKECKGIPTHVETQSAYFSYLQFTPTLKNTISAHSDGKTTVSDYLFNFPAPHYKTLGGITLNINYIHWTAAIDANLNLTDLQVGFSEGIVPGGYSDVPPSLNLTLTGVQSNHPTILVHNSDPAGAIVPNVDVTGIAVAVTLKGWKPNVDGTAVDYSDEDAYFSNSTVIDYVNVSTYVASIVSAKIANMFATSSAHKAISSVISSAVNSRLPANVKISRLIGRDGSWLIYYEPRPSPCAASTVKGPKGEILPNTNCAKAP